jgi:hypothetical protein
MSVLACGSEDLSWWESTAAGDRLFVLNKRTGEVYTLQDGELRPVARNPEAAWEPTIDHEQAARARSVRRKVWMFDDVLLVEAQTKYRNGEVEIRGSIEPYIKNLSTIYVGTAFTLQFLDPDFFRVVEVDIRTDDLTRVVDDEGKPDSYSFAKRVVVKPEDWREAFIMDVAWTNQVDSAVKAWKDANPKDTTERQRLASFDSSSRRGLRRAQLTEAAPSEENPAAIPLSDQELEALPSRPSREAP